MIGSGGQPVKNPPLERFKLKELIIRSEKFKHNSFIPAKYTCDGENVNPSLIIENLPKNTASLALIVDDPDAPMGNWDHWIVWNIPIISEISSYG